ncbi:uncharacterized protein LOC141691191 [Apium graveolens]|uniref:uncharacterized protein LOC141691191 n=1 Tax=Apium graveolens TaxID=4045 RepID=UPI003D79ABCE
MNFLSWNCRGLGNSRAVRVLRDLVKTRKPDFIFLSETLVSSIKISELCLSLGFVHNFAVDCVGRGGGLAVMCKNTVVCNIGSSSLNHIDVEILRDTVPHWRLMCFYGMPERDHIRESWDFIRHLSSISSLPWCIVGDFNDMLFPSDKKGKHNHPQFLMHGFREAIVDSKLVEIDLSGGHFTWEKGKVYSDHDPIQLELCNSNLSKKEFRFKFENTWFHESSFRDEVNQYWDSLSRLQLMPKLISMSSYMAKWGRNFFHKFRDKLCKQREIVNALAEKTDEESIKNYFLEKDKLHELLLHEESYWKQRAKTFWLAEGDANSKFFHAYASARRKTNFISKLRVDGGDFVTKEEDMHRVVLDYFQTVFGE